MALIGKFLKQKLWNFSESSEQCVHSSSDSMHRLELCALKFYQFNLPHKMACWRLGEMKTAFALSRSLPPSPSPALFASHVI